MPAHEMKSATLEVWPSRSRLIPFISSNTRVLWESDGWSAEYTEHGFVSYTCLPTYMLLDSRHHSLVVQRLEQHLSIHPITVEQPCTGPSQPRSSKWRLR
jgi:hypothetical protein